MPTTSTDKAHNPVLPEPSLMQEKFLSDIVHVRRRFLRSVNLERDFYSEAALEGYVATPSALSALERVAAGVGEPTARAFSLTGAYGTGKSAFALLLTKALSLPPMGDVALRHDVCARHSVLTELLPLSAAEGFWPVLVTGSREPIAGALVQGLRRSLARLDAFGTKKSRLAASILQTIFGAVPEADSLDPSGQAAAKLFEVATAEVHAKIPQCRGLLLIVDEMGKFLEWAAHHPEQGDVQALQEIAEAAVRSKENPLIFVTVLHQAFDEYAHRLGSNQRAEWQKVQGRFADIPFGDTSEETLRLISRAIEREPDADPERRIIASATAQAKTAHNFKMLPRSLSEIEFRGLTAQAYPLHALTLLILPAVFRRFGQSERSLFSFLASEEPYGFTEFLESYALNAQDDLPLLRIDGLYDYVVATLGSTLYNHPGAGKLWSQTQEALYRCQDRSPLDVRIVKTIGLLHIIGDQRLLPSREVLRFALLDEESISASDVDKAVTRLEKETLITYRQFKRAYRPYEGSDIDVEAHLREARAQFAGTVDSAATAAKLSATPPMIARRHSFVTGTLRFFDVRIVRPADLTQSEETFTNSNSDGLLFLCLSDDVMEQRATEALIVSKFGGCPDIVVGLAAETEALHEASLTIEALLWVKENVPELRSDHVASREVNERLLDAEDAFQAEWDLLLRPEANNAKSSWFYKGEAVSLASARELQHLLSRACDTAYPYTPRLRNELINRRQLSSTAAAARRNLIEGMIERHDQPLLGIPEESYPAERTMYATVLEDTGIHRQDVEGGPWNIHAPIPERDPALWMVWQAIEAYLFDGELIPKAIPVLYDILRAQPFGLSDGIIPVLLCAALILWHDETILYKEDSFITSLDASTFENLIKRPENFRVQGVRVAGERREVVTRLARTLLKEDEESTVVNVVRALYRNISRLPAYSMGTRQLSADALRLRNLFKEARAPEQFLFSDLPKAVGARPLTADADDRENIDRFFGGINPLLAALLGTYDSLLSRLETELFSAFGVESIEELAVRSNAMRPVVTEPRLASFLQRTGDDTLTARKWLESVAAVVVGRPPFAWTDADETKFVGGLAPLVSAFHSAELVAFAKSDTIDEDQDHVGFRMSVTQASGTEDARIIVMPKKDEQLVSELTDKAVIMLNDLMAGVPDDVRLAVIGRVAQAMMRNGIK